MRRGLPAGSMVSPEQPRRFANAHRLFGVGKILKLIRQNKDYVECLMKSICFESDARGLDPVNGAYGTLRHLLRVAKTLEDQRTALNEKLDMLKAENPANANNAPNQTYDFHPAYNAGPSDPSNHAHARPTRQVAVRESTSAQQHNEVHHIQQYVQQQYQVPALEYYANYNTSGSAFTPVQVAGPSSLKQQQMPALVYYVNSNTSRGAFTPVQGMGPWSEQQEQQLQMPALEYYMNHNTRGGASTPVQVTGSSSLQQQMPALENYVNFNKSGGANTPVQVSGPSSSHSHNNFTPQMHLTGISAEVALFRTNSNATYNGTAARDFFPL